tara:strand:+ start:93260 stop:94225 length:966 start_codon:yes stop_codon:yes gene_type:complete
MAEVYVKCRTALLPAGDPVGDVYVSLHHLNDYAPLASGTTDAEGSVFLGDRAPGPYEIHITTNLRTRIVDGGLQKITVVNEDLNADGNNDPNIFDVLIDTTELPQATDAAFCRCSGNFLDAYGKAVDELTIRFSEGPEELPNLVYYQNQNTAHAVIPSQRVIRTDENGFASIDLMRGEQYTVYMEGYENISRTIIVPDAASAPLPDVIFQYPESIEYKRDGVLLNLNTPTITLNIGQEATLELATIFRSGLRLDGIVDIKLSIPEQDIISGSQADNSLVITALSQGSVTLEVTRVKPESGSGIKALPDPEMRGALSVTVNP